MLIAPIRRWLSRRWLERIRKAPAANGVGGSGLIVRGWFQRVGGLATGQFRPWNVITIEVDGRYGAGIFGGPPQRSMAFVQMRPGHHRVRLIGDNDMVVWDRDVVLPPDSCFVISFVPPPQGLDLKPKPKAAFETKVIRLT